MQSKVKSFNEEKMKNREKMTSESRMLDIQSELGELSKEILKSTNYGTKEFSVTEDYEMEFGDVLYSLLSLANETNIDAEKCLTKALKKYESRMNKKDDIGSGR